MPDPTEPLPPGTPAPPFTLMKGLGETLSLTDYQGRPVVLVFYPADWSPVCGDQLAVYNEIISEFSRCNAQLLGISVDGIFCHDAFSKSIQLEFPLLADFEPKGAVAKRYGVYHAPYGTAGRALFVIDKDGIIRWGYLSPIDENPGADGILSALQSLSEK